MLTAEEIVREAFETVVWEDSWAAIERWITETVEWMWIKGVDFGFGSPVRNELLSDALAIARETYDARKAEKEDSDV